MVIVYFGKYNDAGKMSALEREGYRVKYVKGDNEKVEDTLDRDSEEMI